VVPKEHTVFRFELPIIDVPLDGEKQAQKGGEQTTEDDVMHVDRITDDQPRPLVFELQGSSLEVRATDRSTRKFVLHLPPDL
jgi:hypothetical protein